MKLDTVEQRCKFVSFLTTEAREFMLLAREFEDDYDWAGAKFAYDDLEAIEKTVRAEEFFVQTFCDLYTFPTSNRKEKDRLLDIFYCNGVLIFIQEVLLPKLEYLLKVLDEWGFRTEEGVEFKDFICKRLEKLIKKYLDLYEL